MGLIDKDATLKAIADYLRADLADCNHYYLQGAQDVAEVVEDMPEVGGWIPCSERLPEVHESGNSFSGIYMQSYPVLVYGASEYDGKYRFHIATYCDDLDGTTYWSTEADAETVNGVTAWMPLPECYRGENDG